MLTVETPTKKATAARKGSQSCITLVGEQEQEEISEAVLSAFIFARV